MKPRFIIDKALNLPHSLGENKPQVHFEFKEWRGRLPLDGSKAQQNLPLQNNPLWHKDYLELVILKEQQT